MYRGSAGNWKNIDGKKRFARNRTPEQKDGRILKEPQFKFPIYMNGRNALGMDRDNESTDEYVTLLRKKLVKDIDKIPLLT